MGPEQQVHADNGKIFDNGGADNQGLTTLIGHG